MSLKNVLISVKSAHIGYLKEWKKHNMIDLNKLYCVVIYKVDLPCSNLKGVKIGESQVTFHESYYADSVATCLLLVNRFWDFVDSLPPKADCTTFYTAVIYDVQNDSTSKDEHQTEYILPLLPLYLDTKIRKSIIYPKKLTNIFGERKTDDYNNNNL